MPIFLPSSADLPFHPPEERLGDDDAGDFVGHELGVFVAGEGPDARDKGDVAVLDGGLEGEEHLGIEDGLGDGILGPGGDFEAESVDLAVEVGGDGVCADAEGQRERFGQCVAGDVAAGV